VLQGDYVEKWYVKLLTVTSIKAVKCFLPLLFDSPSYILIHTQESWKLHQYVTDVLFLNMSADTTYIMSSHPSLSFSVFISTSITDHGLLHASSWSTGKQREKLCVTFTQMQEDPPTTQLMRKIINY
jgi:hypothetical protein